MLFRADEFLMARNLTRAEAAAQLNVSPRWLSDYIRSEGLTVLRAGHRMLFDEGSLAVIKESMRCPISSSRQIQPVARRSTRSGARKTGNTWIEVHQRAIDAKRKRG